MNRNRHWVVIAFLSCVLAFSVCAHAADDPQQLFDKGVAAYNDGKYDEAISLWEQALPLYKGAGDIEHVAMVLNNIGLIRFQMRQYEESVGYFKEALTIDRKRGISKDIAGDLQNTGLAYFHLAEYDQALSAFKESAVIFDSIGDVAGAAANLQQTGLVEFALGEYVEAGRYFIAASDLHRGLRDRQGYALDLMELGDVYVALDRFDKALENYEEALKVREVLGEIEPYVNTKIKIARVFGANGRYDEGLDYLRQAKKDAKEAKSDPLMGDIASAWGEILDSSGDAEGALASFDEALSLMKKGNDLSGAGMVLTNQGIILSELLRLADAKKSFEDARLIYQVSKDQRNEAKVLINLGNLANDVDDLDGAFSYYSQADTLLVGEKGGAVSGVNYLGMGEVYLKKKEFKKARTTFETAGKLLAGERDKRYGAKISAYLGLLDYYEGNYSSSVGRFNNALTILRKENSRTLVADILIGTGMSLVATNRPDVASGYFTEAKRLAEDLMIAPIVWRAEYGDGLVKEKGGNGTTARARYKDAFFRLSEMPDIVPTLYGARLVTVDDLLDKLSSAGADAAEKGSFDRARVRDDLDGILGLFTKTDATFTPKEQKLVDRIKETMGRVNYLEKRLADDEYRKGNNTGLFTKKLLAAQGEYLKELDDIRDDAPELWDTYFSGLYE
jgi:tetratricopeptide (TPR) repeat protein